MLIAFSTVYYMTYQNTSREIESMLLAMTKRPIELIDDKPVDPREIDEKRDDRIVGFFVSVDNSNAIKFYGTTFDLSLDKIENAMHDALANLEEERIEIDGIPFAFRIITVANHKDIHFVDISTHQNLLNQLLYTFMGVTTLTLVFIILVSSYMTHQNIKPIKKAFEKQNQFISDASHELKTPLAVIQANSDVLKKEQPSNPWVGYIQHEVHRMKKLTETLLDLSQFESIDFSKEHDHVDIGRIVEHQYLILEAVAFEKNIQFDIALEDKLITYGHKEQLQQVICILLDNALKYTPEHGHIKINSRTSNNHIYIFIKNTGELIQEKERHKLFDRFYQGDSSRTQDSSYGLGLSIAQTIMQRHHGKISVFLDNKFNVFELKMKKH